MASTTTFKQSCPSCEAMVPIRDPGLIGKKVECPKCKYRFVVEEPEDFEPSTAPARGGNRPRPKAKKQSGSNSTLIIGLGLGAVIVVLLVVGGIFMFGNKEDSKPKSSGSNPAVASNTTPTNPTPTPAPTDSAPAASTLGDPTQPGLPTQPTTWPGGPVAEITNLLPNDSQMVLAVNMDKLRYSTLGRQAFESRYGFRPNMFKERLGIAIEDMDQYLRAENVELKWGFNVIRTKKDKPVRLEELKKVLDLKKVTKGPIKGRDYYQVPPNDLLDNLGQILQSELETKEAKAPKKNMDSGPLGLVLLDPWTVVIANVAPLEEFLNSGPDGATPRPQSRPDKPAETDPNAPPTDRPAPRGRGMNSPASFNVERYQKPAPRGGPPTDNPPPAEQPGEGPLISQNAKYLTIEPPLKEMIERLDTDPNEPPIAVLAQFLNADKRLVDRVRQATGFRQFEEVSIHVLGVVLYKYGVEKLHGTAAVTLHQVNDAKEIEAVLKKLLNGVAQFISAYFLGIKVDAEGAEGGSSPGDTGAAGPAGRGIGGGRGAPPGQNPGGGEQPGTRPNLPGVQSGEGIPNSKIKLSRRGKTLLFEVDLNLPTRSFDRLYAVTENAVSRMRGMVDMANPLPYWFELADAGQKLLHKDNAVPRGTFARSDTTGSRLARSWPPHQRVGWMAGLLPHLGHDDLYRQIEKDKSWREEVNRKVGSILIPAFLDPRYPRNAWRASLPSLGARDVAATHYVGIAGVGVEAGDYKASDPAMAKKLGMFGYDRSTSLKDVSDGLSNTVFMVQVPPNYPRPWIAGGGATVMGVPETRSFRPFVYTHGAKPGRGAYLIMADGSVRFLAEGVSDDVFKALCTIKGGEEIGEIEKIAPKVKPGSVELKTETAKKDEDATKDGSDIP